MVTRYDMYIAHSSGAVQVDTNKDGLVDLKELTTALSKWRAFFADPESRNDAHPFATAEDIALDFFILMSEDPRRSASTHLTNANPPTHLLRSHSMYQ